MTRAALLFAYDGARFDSFARQPGRRTVEGELLRTLRERGVIDDARSARYAVASRTDAGVSALRNVCALDVRVDPRSVPHVHGLPDGVWILGSLAVDAGFSPRDAAIERTYQYLFDAPRPFDWAAARQAARIFVGLHDFQAFVRRDADRTTRRRVTSARVLRRRGEGVLQVRAPNFAWEQVRRMVNAVLRVGRGEGTLRAVEAQLRSGRPTEPPAPPEHLVLSDVNVGLQFPAPSRVTRDGIVSARKVARATASFYDEFAASLPTDRR